MSTDKTRPSDVNHTGVGLRLAVFVGVFTMVVFGVIAAASWHYGSMIRDWDVDLSWLGRMLFTVPVWLHAMLALSLIALCAASLTIRRRMPMLSIVLVIFVLSFVCITILIHAIGMGLPVYSLLKAAQG